MGHLALQNQQSLVETQEPQVRQVVPVLCTNCNHLGLSLEEADLGLVLEVFGDRLYPVPKAYSSSPTAR